MGIRPRGQRELDRDQELEEAEEDPQEPARRVLGLSLTVPTLDPLTE